eukprot:g24756.t1
MAMIIPYTLHSKHRYNLGLAPADLRALGVLGDGAVRGCLLPSFPSSTSEQVAYYLMDPEPNLVNVALNRCRALCGQAFARPWKFYGILPERNEGPPKRLAEGVGQYSRPPEVPLFSMPREVRSAEDGPQALLGSHLVPLLDPKAPVFVTMVFGKMSKYIKPFSERDRKAAVHPYAPEATGLPVLTIDGKAYAQSRAILRYLGRICSYEGNPLYPLDPMEQLECDEMIEVAEDLRQPLLGSFAIQDQAEKEAFRANLFAEDGKMTKWLKVVDRMLGQKFPSKVTIGTIYLWSLVTMLRQPTFLDGVPADALAPYGNISKLHQFMLQVPPILEYFATKENRENYKPLA